MFTHNTTFYAKKNNVYRKYMMAEQNNIYDVIIIGAGIAGLNSAYQLSKKYPQMRVLILEKDVEHLGGRILTYSDAIYQGVQVEAGAARFHDKQVHIQKLLTDLGFTEKDKAILPVSDTFYNVQNRHRTINPSDDIVRKIIAETKKTKATAEQLRAQNIIEYARHVLVEQEIELLKGSFGYYTELVEMNAFDFIQLIENHLNNTYQYYALKHGLVQIIERLQENLEKNQNVTLLKNHQVVSIQQTTTNVYEIGCKSRRLTHSCKKVIVALPKQVVAQIAFFSSIKNVLNEAIYCGKLCRIYAKFPKSKNNKIWFEGMTKFTTNNHLRMVIPISEKHGIIMVSYSDHKYAKHWKNIYETRGMEGLVNELMKEMKQSTGLEDIPMPVQNSTKIFYWECGVGYWTRNTDSSQISARLQQPIPNENVFLCGEHYSEKNQEWMEGALETSNQIVSTFFV